MSRCSLRCSSQWVWWFWDQMHKLSFSTFDELNYCQMSSIVVSSLLLKRVLICVNAHANVISVLFFLLDELRCVSCRSGEYCFLFNIRSSCFQVVLQLFSTNFWLLSYHLVVSLRAWCEMRCGIPDQPQSVEVPWTFHLHIMEPNVDFEGAYCGSVASSFLVLFYNWIFTAFLYFFLLNLLSCNLSINIIERTSF